MARAFLANRGISRHTRPVSSASEASDAAFAFDDRCERDDHRERPVLAALCRLESRHELHSTAFVVAIDADCDSEVSP